MTAFDEGPPDRRPPGAALPQRPRGTYTMHPLQALDGVLIHVTRGGESFGSFFGRTERAAAAAVARELVDVIPHSTDGAAR